MTKILYLDCFSGISGDMLLGALLDIGVEPAEVAGPLHAMIPEGWSFQYSPATKRGAIRAGRVNVIVQVTGPQRSPSDIQSMIDGSHLPGRVKARAERVFRLLAEAEAAVHGGSVEDIHFHEVGALDAIIDIVGCCLALEQLQVDRIVCSPLATGRGLTTSGHGEIPIPGPAVTEIARRKNIPLEGRGKRELVTPTGIALVGALADEFGHLPPMVVSAVGYGAGRRNEAGVPNVVRAILGDTARGEEDAGVQLIESNIDDATPELLAHVVERLLEEGAQDAWLTPIVMKKGRPAHLLSVLAATPDVDRLAGVVFEESTTFGVRITRVHKRALDREWLTVRVEGHPLQVKIARLGGQVVTMSPEYDEAVVVARSTGLPLKDVYARTLEAARERLKVP